MEKYFKLKENKTDVKTEILAGITTFMTMVYILAVNPGMLSETGMDFGGVFTATALSAGVATLIMALYAKYPFALAPGMGLNAFFTYSVCIGMKQSWQFALTAVLVEGIIFILLSLLKVREAIFDLIPLSLKKAVSAGIGLFIALVGLKNAGIIVANEGTTIGLGDLTANASIVALLGLIVIAILYARNVKGALLIGIIIATIIGIPLGVTTLPEGFKIFSLPPSLKDVAFKFVPFSEIMTKDFWIIVVTFLFVDIFDTVGTLAGVASKSGMLDKEGKLPRVSRALTADAVGTIFGACMGTSTVTTFVESSAGVAAGGRTGLTSVTTGIMFILALFIAPLFAIIPAAATAPVLVVVGVFMMSAVMEINWHDLTEAVPAFLTIAMMPFAYSIAEGIVFGIVSYTLIKTFTGKAKDVSALMWVLSVLFVLREIFL
ncbi:AGZA family xanthine/uracil permease-like MFS transporter [Ezakiella coagulans]|uniref:AGZA family xanthine/uracil permease-like MFS transporter n=1 Tax=Ezakiella coagulans TaxID=46507 RepID=A0A2U1E5U6_9FIRM|nr:NCS2 family permease [Ezakiella coagulans]PVY95320.1 AGZA family xanthine/uracil permease-like MFS transporter [Ezakiella coagulans]